MEEIFKDIKGYEGYYQVSNLGTVRSVDRRVKSRWGGYRLSSGKILNQQEIRGYKRVEFSRDSRVRKMFMVHRLVVEAFIKKIPNKMQVNHIDGNKHNNNVNNLEIVTASENIRHSIDVLGNNHTFKKGKPLNYCNKPKEIICNETKEVFKSIRSAAKKLKISNSVICSQLKGRQKTAGGYTFCYMNYK
jgi:hypothetical protein